MGRPDQKKRVRSSEYVSDDFVANDSDSDRATKRVKTVTKSSQSASAGEAQTDENGDQYWEISRTRRVTVSTFKGMKMINVREYYEKDGNMLPGKKGISMTLEQYSKFIEILPQIETLLKKKGQDVPRPKYDNDDITVEDEEEGESEEDVKASIKEEEDTLEHVHKRKGDGSQKKSNIEATSDEDDEK